MYIENMSMNRIQKLLFSEYKDFEDMVLVESPFAETTRQGRGLRQVHLGLTPTKLVVATDVLREAHLVEVGYIPGLDPEVETLELVSVYPVEFVNLSIFHRHKRNTIKAHFCNNKIVYYELGGIEYRKMFWNLWCERVRFLSSEGQANSSRSETSKTSTTSDSTLYVVTDQYSILGDGRARLWRRYSTIGEGSKMKLPRSRWTEKHLYLGPQSRDRISFVPPRISLSEITHVTLPTKKRSRPKDIHMWPSSFSHTQVHADGTVGRFSQINRFASGVLENCSTGLFLDEKTYIIEHRWSQRNWSEKPSMTCQQVVDLTSQLPSNLPPTFFANRHQSPTREVDKYEEAVLLWEQYKSSYSPKYRKPKHKRRYGLAPKPLFLNGVGPWNVGSGERHSVQGKRAVSAVTIRRQPREPELCLTVPRHELTTSLSYTDVRHAPDRAQQRVLSPTYTRPKKLILFWTPQYWYRPKTRYQAYHDIRNHISRITAYQQAIKIKEFRKPIQSRIWRTLHKAKLQEHKSHSRENSMHELPSSDGDGPHKRKRCKTTYKREKKKKEHTTTKAQYTLHQDSGLMLLKKSLKLEVLHTAWDFDSSTLAHQITMIDTDLFLNITTAELGILIWGQCPKNAFNIRACIAFAHRISCLTATEILRNDSEKMRARLIARFINVADKCNRLRNFQSCRSILAGLQSPPIYRLNRTWSYLRRWHSSKYIVFEQLCRRYRDVRLPSYRLAFQEATENPPYLPFIGDLLALLLDRIPHIPEELLIQDIQQNIQGVRAHGVNNFKKLNTMINNDTTKSTVSTEPNLIRRLLSAFCIWTSTSSIKSSERSKRRSITRFQRGRCKCKPISSRSVKTLMRSSEFGSDSVTESVTEIPSSVFPPSIAPNIELLLESLTSSDARAQRLREGTKLLHIYQKAAANYSLSQNEHAMEYLLKARYKEEKDNFIHSFNVEDAIL